MQVRHFFIFTTLVLLLFPADLIFAQELTTNENGEKIVVYPDGSWRYFDQQDVTKGENENAPENDADIGEMLKRQKGESSKSKKSRKGKKNKKESLPENIGELEIIMMADKAAAEEEALKRIYEDFLVYRISLEENLSEAYHDDDMSSDEIEQVETQLLDAKEKEAVAKADYRKARERSKKMSQLIGMSPGKRMKALAKLQRDYPTEPDEPEVIEEPEEAFNYTADVDFTESNYEGILTPERPPVRIFDGSENVLRHPPSTPCELVYDDIDEFSRKKRKETSQKVFFTHTPERFQQYFKGRNYMICKGAVVAIDDNPRYVNFEFTIATQQAMREFGILEKGSQIIIKLLDGSKVILLSNKISRGTLDESTKTTQYNVQCLLNKAHVKSLSSIEVDKVRVIWATGYEDYEVYDVDFFIDLLECVK